MKIVVLFSLIVLLSPISIMADTIHIGLRAHSGAEKDMAKWQPTADYLSQKIPEHRFVMIPFEDLKELSRAAERTMFDFVLTNPSSYVDLEKKFGASRILTLQNLRQGGAYTQFGSVIFTRQDNSEINDLQDIRNKRFMAVAERAFGGWRVAWKEFLDNDIDPYTDFKQIQFSGGIQEQVVHAVLNGKADAGSVRTDMLESMAARGETDLSQIKIIHRKDVKGFPFLLSTQLYPEWPFAKFRHTSSELAQKVSIALLSIPSQHPAAAKGKYYGWTVPLDYQPVHALLQSLKVDAYSDYGEINLLALITRYWYIVLSIFFTLLISWMVTVNILRTNRKLSTTQEALTKSKRELEERVKERTFELEKALKLAEEANSAKTHFLSRMSHELRTPMNAILGFSQLMESNPEGTLSEENQDNVSEIMQAGKHLLKLINEVLELAQIESGKIKLANTEVNLKKIVDECIKVLSPLSRAKNIEITTDTHSCVAFTDATRVKQILINLLSNAIKYNHYNGSISVECIKEDANWIKVSVSNTGAGIAIDNFESIFEPFERLKGSESEEGTGIGLAVSKQLVEAMGGSIGVNSTTDGTTLFWFRLKTLLPV